MKAIEYYIGWDVGGWNCDHNPKSRDALVILNRTGEICGTPWRGNLRTSLNRAQSAKQLIEIFFALCESNYENNGKTLIAIDTPLGFSDQFISLITRHQDAGIMNDSASNSYLYRRTERFLHEQGLTPLSAIKDMIGSQATKGIHLLARFAANIQQCGVWTDGQVISAIEAYPSPCRKSSVIQSMLENYPTLPHNDHRDALICALLAKLFCEKPEIFCHPPDDVPIKEGWIWLPCDALGK